MRTISRRAFAVSDLGALIAVVGVMLCLVAVVGARPRALASLSQTVANIKQISDTIATHGSDNADLAPGFSWKKGSSPSSYADLKTAATDLEAAANQFVDIVRRRSNVPNFAKLASFAPHPSFLHVMLADYLNAPLPQAFTVSPEDRNLIKWSSDPSKWQANGAPNAQSAFRSSYEICYGLWALTDSGSNAVTQDGQAWNIFTIPTATVVGQRQLSAITYPAHKAQVWDLFQRHYGPRVGFFMYDEARVPVAMFDGSVNLRAGKNANSGWKPQTPASTFWSNVTYQPGANDPPALSGGGSDVLRGKFRWTRKTVAGRDFDAGEVN